MSDIIHSDNYNTFMLTSLLCSMFILHMFSWDDMCRLTCQRVTVKHFTFVSPNPHVASLFLICFSLSVIVPLSNSVIVL